MSEDVYCFEREADLSGKRIMSVTGVIRRAGLTKFFISKARLAALAERGRGVHMIAADIARGNTPPYWEGTEFEGWAKSIKRFIKDHDFVAEQVETPIRNEQFGYMGRLDTFGLLQANSPRRRRYALIEYKCGASARWHLLQTAAYVNGLPVKSASNGLERVAVYLREDSTYSVERHTDPFDFSRFTAALGTARLREAWGLVNERDEREFDRLISEPQEELLSI